MENLDYVALQRQVEIQQPFSLIRCTAEGLVERRTFRARVNEIGHMLNEIREEFGDENIVRIEVQNHADRWRILRVERVISDPYDTKMGEAEAKGIGKRDPLMVLLAMRLLRRAVEQVAAAEAAEAGGAGGVVVAPAAPLLSLTAVGHGDE